jgi:BirA family biotin operon repressor/biotin-[acetyl-CoA-carboxylase] ligase
LYVFKFGLLLFQALGFKTQRLFFANSIEQAMEDTLILEAVDSTNRVARELAYTDKPHGYGLLAGLQTAGRGRIGKAWQSPPDAGLYCTILLRPNLEIKDYGKITLTTGLAVSLVLEKLYNLKPQLKWPNDIYIEGRKCSGILVETSSLEDTGGQNFALVGIGVNVNNEKNEFDLELQKTATSIFIETGRKQDILSLFAAIRSQLLHSIAQLERKGFDDILNQWRKRDMLHKKWTSWVTPAGKVVYGESQGVDRNGVLRIRDRAGKSHEVLSGDVSLAVKSNAGQKAE